AQLQGPGGTVRSAPRAAWPSSRDDGRTSVVALCQQRFDMRGEACHPQCLCPHESVLEQPTGPSPVTAASPGEEHAGLVALRAGNPGPASHPGVLGEGRLKVRLGLWPALHGGRQQAEGAGARSEADATPAEVRALAGIGKEKLVQFVRRVAITEVGADL